ncbi:C3a anaphylatoxin chemotactic receptor [Pimephales promelas]|uniref:C3a anaphylatoxin chemotactic receptor n=1 Tax=Pimephales promelas TaxID=90988 RepID=UPI001955B449|nr:C3a anaphylatoxin chemotactic receptor [Pimephales promelas]XP_039527327.1 C3a anaphylatoxin chemotactic receptor [Pimephales promelas]
MNQTSQYFEENYMNFSEHDDQWSDYESKTIMSSEVSSAMRVISLVVYSLTFLLGVPGNIFVVYIAGMKMKRTVNTVWFLNLATADLLCCLCIPFSVAEILLDHHWPYGSVMCKILPSVIVINMFASVFTLNLISLDRFTQVITPVWAQNHRSLFLARLSCVVAWVLALVLSLPFMILRQTFTEVDFNITLCTFHADEDGDFTTSGMLSIIRFVFGFLIPLICITSCYGVIARKLGTSHFHSGRAFRIMLAVIVAFFLCWLPYHTVDLMMKYGGESRDLALALDPLAISLAYINSCLNPILYVFMGQDFKNKVKLSLRRVFERAFTEEGTQMSRSTQSQQIHSV